MRIRGQAGRGWIDFALVSLAQWSVCTLAARWIAVHVLTASFIDIFALTFGVAGLAGVVIRRQLFCAAPPDSSASHQSSATIQSYRVAA